MSDEKTPIEVIEQKLIDFAQLVGEDMHTRYMEGLDIHRELTQTMRVLVEQAMQVKTVFTGPILLSNNLNKVICTVPGSWHVLYIDWRDGSNTGWSTYTNVVVNRGGFFQFRFQNCPFALQINAAGELKCYSIDSGKEAFIKSVGWQ